MTSRKFMMVLLASIIIFKSFSQNILHSSFLIFSFSFGVLSYIYIYIYIIAVPFVNSHSAQFISAPFPAFHQRFFKMAVSTAWECTVCAAILGSTTEFLNHDCTGDRLKCAGKMGILPRETSDFVL